MHTASTYGGIQGSAGLLCLVTVAEVWLDKLCSRGGVSQNSQLAGIDLNVMFIKHVKT